MSQHATISIHLNPALRYLPLALIIITLQSCGANFDMKLKFAAAGINKTCPKMIDNQTRLDSVTVRPHKEMVYHYTLIKIIKNRFDVDAFEGYMKPIMQNQIRTNEGLKTYRDNKAVMTYDYKDKDGKPLVEMVFTSETYKEEAKPADYQLQLRCEASVVNCTAPNMLDEITRLDSSRALPGKIFETDYTIITMEKSKMNAEKFAENMRPSLLENIKENNDLKRFREHKVIVNYNYYDKNGELITNISITPNDYYPEPTN